jgi:hypothetical protein
VSYAPSDLATIGITAAVVLASTASELAAAPSRPINYTHSSDLLTMEEIFWNKRFRRTRGECDRSVRFVRFWRNSERGSELGAGDVSPDNCWVGSDRRGVLAKAQIVTIPFL